MRSGLRRQFGQWIAERAELLVLAFTVLTTASLVVWWTILLRDEMRTGELRDREVLQLRASGEYRCASPKGRRPSSGLMKNSA